MTKLPPLTLIPAGAGSGKTHTIQKRLAQWLSEGLVAPERIVAVTFTEAAAGELRTRIQGELTQQGRIEDALALEGAYISTIHGFGLRLLKEYAFDAGLSPEPGLLSKDEEGLLVSLQLSSSRRADVLMSRLKHYGYSYDFVSGMGAEEVFRASVIDLISTLRSIGRSARDPALLSHARAMIEERYGPLLDGEALDAALRRSVGDLLAAFPNDLSDGFPDNKAARAALAKDFRNLSEVAKDPGLIEREWRVWKDLAAMRVSNSRAPLPEGYDEKAQAVMDAAAQLHRHPGPLKDAVDHVDALLGTALDALEHYDAAKRERALFDYTDMVALATELLRGNDVVIAALRERVDCLVIDEFQDTNPLQFALLWSLYQAGVPTLIVGDVKQGIMGFQGADVRLLEKLTRDSIAHATPLTGNWRSSSRLMAILNRVATGLFPEAHANTGVELEPRAQYESELVPLELLSADGKVRECEAALPRAVAARVRAMLDDASLQVWDRSLQRHRAIRGEDIAVLGLTNRQLDRYAEALRERGVAVRRDAAGWLESRVIQLMWYALSYVADPGDRHAALYLAVTELGRMNLEDAVRALLDGEPLDDYESILPVLRQLAESRTDHTVDALIDPVIDALGLWDEISSWPDAAQARANLLRLRGEASEFQAARGDTLASAGLHGRGLKTFLAWLVRKVEHGERDADLQPAPRIREQDAVELTTWHSAKGREWPVVVVATTATRVAPRLPDTEVVHTDFDDLEQILARARVEISPRFDAIETSEAFLAPLEAPAEADARRLLYVALTRARERVILEWPAFVGSKKNPVTTYWSLLKHDARMRLDGDELTLAGEVVECEVSDALRLAAEGSEAGSGAGEVTASLPVVGRRALSRFEAVPCAQRTPESVTPSSLHGVGEGAEVAGELRSERYGASLDLALELPARERGNVLHRCFEVLPGRDLDPGQLSVACDFVIEAADHAVIAEAVRRFDTWLDTELAARQVWREIPLLGMMDQSVVVGAADVLVETRQGLWIIDHKSDRADDRRARFAYYQPQLEAYAKVIGEASRSAPVVGLGINWVSYGEVMLLPWTGGSGRRAGDARG